jgi:hypothetical protein
MEAGSEMRKEKLGRSKRVVQGAVAGRDAALPFGSSGRMTKACFHMPNDARDDICWQGDKRMRKRRACAAAARLQWPTESSAATRTQHFPSSHSFNASSGPAP